MPQPASPRSPYYTDQQWLQLLQMGDLGDQERKIASQRALAEQLRKSNTGAGRMDWGSQAGRGLEGLAGGIYDLVNIRDQRQLKADTQAWLDKIAAQQAAAQAAQQGQPEPYSVLNRGSSTPGGYGEDY